MHWWIEDLSDGQDQRLPQAALSFAHRVTRWDDHAWETGRLVAHPGEVVLFHGSLANAARLATDPRVSPGAFCNTDALAYSAWAPLLEDLLVTPLWTRTTVAQAVASSKRTLAGQHWFIRPDSPLKPFSGRVCDGSTLSLASLDFGFYFDDPNLPIVVAPAVSIGAEWRAVVVSGEVIAGSGYVADGRRSTGGGLPPEVRVVVEAVVARVPMPDPAVVIDIAETNDGLRVVELNPFSGADLYDCDRRAIVAAIAGVF